MGLEMEVFPNGNIAPGCTLPVAINYNPQASIDDGSCLLSGCTDENALNFHPAMTVDDGTCLYLEDFASSCPSDGDGDGSYGTGDLLQLLTLFGTTCN